MLRRIAGHLSYFILPILTLIADQVSKAQILKHFVPYDPFPLFPGLSITLAFNPGAAFSFLSGPEPWHAWFFIAFAVLMSCLLVTWLLQLPPKHKLLVVAYGLILGGALSNLWDRLTLGQVVDFIDLYYQTHHWPIFNVADSAICVGVCLWIWDWHLSKSKEG